MYSIFIKRFFQGLLVTMTCCIMISCRKEYPLKKLPTEPKLFIECMPGLVLDMNTQNMDDASSMPDLECSPLAIEGVSFEVMLAKPAGGSIDGLDIENTGATLLVNGKSTPLTKTVGVSSNLNVKKAVFSTSVNLYPGDHLSLDVSLEGVKSVHSESVIPEPIPGINAILENSGGDLIAKITLPDDPHTDDFFAIGINYKAVLHNTTTEAETVFTDNLHMDGPDPQDFPDLVNSCLIIQNDSFVFFNDGGASNGKCTVNLIGKFLPDTEKNNMITRYSYQIVCYRLSPEYFYYARSQQQVSNNILGQLGFAPGIFSYTNISRGMGVMGSMSMSVTGWISNSELKKN